MRPPVIVESLVRWQASTAAGACVGDRRFHLAALDLGDNYRYRLAAAEPYDRGNGDGEDSQRNQAAAQPRRVENGFHGSGLSNGATDQSPLCLRLPQT